MKIIEKNGKEFIQVKYKSSINEEESQKWLFRELNVGEFMDIDVTKDAIEGKTQIAQATIPTMLMINLMMVEGKKITKQTKLRIFGHLKNELAPFLV